MANLHTSALVEPVEDLVDLVISQVALDQITVTVDRYSAGDEFIENIIPPTVYVENDVENETHIRVYLNAAQVAAGEKIQVKLDN